MAVSTNTQTTGVAGGAGVAAVGSGVYPTYTWAAKPAVTPNDGAIIRISDVGAGTGGAGGGSYFFRNGARWKPLNASIVLDSVDTANAGVANTTEQNLNPNHILIPGGVIGNFDRLRLWVSLSKNAAVDTGTIRIRFGSAGTIADTLIATVPFAAANQSLGILLEFKRLSATSIQKQGNASTDTSYSGGSTSVYPAAVTVQNMDSVAQYLSITSQMTAGTEIMTLQDYTLELYATDSF